MFMTGVVANGVQLMAVMFLEALKMPPKMMMLPATIAAMMRVKASLK